MIASIVFASTPCAFNATCVDAPQSIRNVLPRASRRKHVLNRPPEPNASPDPTMVSRMSGRRTRTLADLRVPAAQIGKLLGHDQPCRPHEVSRDRRRDIGDGVLIAGNRRAFLEFAVEQPEEFEHARPAKLIMPEEF